MNKDISYFAGCPHCDSTDGYVNIGKGHWFVCDLHKTQWYYGSNIFSSWKEQTETQQRAIFENVTDYETVSPVHSNRWKSKWMSKNAPTTTSARLYDVNNRE